MNGVFGEANDERFLLSAMYNVKNADEALIALKDLVSNVKDTVNIEEDMDMVSLRAEAVKLSGFFAYITTLIDVISKKKE
jgi:hypothetical protein